MEKEMKLYLNVYIEKFTGSSGTHGPIIITLARFFSNYSIGFDAGRLYYPIMEMSGSSIEECEQKFWKAAHPDDDYVDGVNYARPDPILDYLSDIIEWSSPRYRSGKLASIAMAVAG